MFEMDSFDWSNRIRYHIVNTIPDAEFKGSHGTWRALDEVAIIGTSPNETESNLIDVLLCGESRGKQPSTTKSTNQARPSLRQDPPPRVGLHSPRQGSQGGRTKPYKRAEAKCLACAISRKY
jgi:hypothetical protein